MFEVNFVGQVVLVMGVLCGIGVVIVYEFVVCGLIVIGIVISD